MTVQQPRQQLGMISVPWQEYTTPYAPAEALMYGTVFSGLNQPYIPINMQQSAPGAQNMQMQQMQQTGQSQQNRKRKKQQRLQSR